MVRHGHGNRRVVPFRGCEEEKKRAKREEEKRSFIARARFAKKNLAIPLIGYLRLEPVSLFVLCELANRRGLYLYLRLDLNTSQMYARPKYYYVDRKPRVV